MVRYFARSFAELTKIDRMGARMLGDFAALLTRWR